MRSHQPIQRIQPHVVLSFGRADRYAVGHARFIPSRCDDLGWHMLREAQSGPTVFIAHAELFRQLADGVGRLLLGDGEDH
jgi:hypothetical protein